MLLSKCAACDSRKSKFIKDQQFISLVSTLRTEDTFKQNSFSRSSFVSRVLNKLVQGVKQIKQLPCFY